MATRAFESVTALVDWNSQIHASKLKKKKGISIEELTQGTLDYVGGTISRALSREGATQRFDVTLRAYYGWHRGFEPTAARKALTSIAAGRSAPLSVKANVIIRPTIYFGDALLSANPTRFHSKLACHLPNTLRPKPDNKYKFEEKMVDTALVADLLHIAVKEPQQWIVVLGEDDDLVPPLMTAEAARRKTDGRIILIRERNFDPFLKLEGLVVKP